MHASDPGSTGWCGSDMASHAPASKENAPCRVVAALGSSCRLGTAYVHVPTSAHCACHACRCMRHGRHPRQRARRGFLLGPRLAEARGAGRTERESDFCERNLRTQLTVWGTSQAGGSEVEDYANREWAGLVGTYYRPRCVQRAHASWNNGRGIGRWAGIGLSVPHRVCGGES